MSNRGYKLQEFVAHSSNVKCLKIGRKSKRLVVTGGDDHKVNLWAIGKATSLLSLSGHSSSVESLAFDSAEALVVSGASTGAIKLWDLEEAKIIRTFTGLSSSCSAVEFHPFGEFFASGSSDSNLKIWDFRKKGCIHTYVGHTRRVNTIKFTPDGRWVVSGGADNVVKIWDLTAGKLLHEFNFHEGEVQCLDFHPVQFLLATGSADRTVNFWDLETFELIGSAGPEDMGIRSMAFHPDGRTLFSGMDDSMKVFSWEPIVCHDEIQMGWSKLGDLSIHDGNIVACSHYGNSIGVWAADISLIGPYGVATPGSNKKIEEKFSTRERYPEQIHGSNIKSNSELLSQVNSPSEIRNIYVDSSLSKKNISKRVGSTKYSTKLTQSSDLSEANNPSSRKKNPYSEAHVELHSPVTNKQVTIPVIVPRNSSTADYGVSSKREITVKTNASMLRRATDKRNPTTTRLQIAKISVADEPESLRRKSSNFNSSDALNFHFSFFTKSEAEAINDTNESIKNVAEKIESTLPPDVPMRSDPIVSSEPQRDSRVINSLTVANGARLGRTRSLVQRWEKREVCNNESPVTSGSIGIISETNVPFHMSEKSSPHVLLNEVVNLNKKKIQSTCLPPDVTQSLFKQDKGSVRALPDEVQRFSIQDIRSDDILSEEVQSMTKQERSSACVFFDDPCSLIPQGEESQDFGKDSPIAKEEDVIEDLMQNHDQFLSSLRSRLTKLQVVRQYWRRNDIKGGIGAVGKLPDHSVQADVISILSEKVDVINLTLFSCLLPVAVGLLNSKVDRHSNISLEILLKIVATFGPVVHSTMSAPPSVGVDIQAERRRDYCKKCSIQLQKIKRVLPSVIRRGGLVAKHAQELNLVLQVS